MKKAYPIFMILFFLIGLSLLLYPTLSNYWNSFHQSRAIASYAEAVSNIDDDKYAQIWESAEEYNRSLVGKTIFQNVLDLDEQNYSSMLDLTGTGIMGYIEIPAIDCSLPIYHGTDEGVLQIAIGHLSGTSLPVGGENTHCVLSGHRGLPSARLFTDIDKLVVGDTFLLRVLDDLLTYEVDQILIVLPNEFEALEIETGRDYCTLITCTPYGINTHRLLVRGHRVDTVISSAKAVRVTADAFQIKTTTVAGVVAVPIMVLLFLVLIALPTKRKSNSFDYEEEI